MHTFCSLYLELEKLIPFEKLLRYTTVVMMPRSVYHSIAKALHRSYSICILKATRRQPAYHPRISYQTAFDVYPQTDSFLPPPPLNQTLTRELTLLFLTKISVLFHFRRIQFNL